MTTIHVRTPVCAAAEPVRAAAGPVLVVVCGGAGVTRGQLATWERDLGLAA